MNDDLHALTGAYVLDALDQEEREAFEAYMATSPATAAEVASLREVAAFLSAGAAETPPEGLRRAVLDQIDTVRQDRPVVALPDPRLRRTSERGPSGGPTGGGDGAPTSLERHRWVTRGLAAVAALAAAIAVGLGVTVATLSDRVDEVEETSAQVATLLAAPDAVRQEAPVPTGGVVTALISPGHGAVAIAEGLPPLEDDRMYALWGLRDGAPIPIGELRNGRPLTIESSGLSGLGLTVEPRGPLTQPTGVVQVTLTA